MPRVVKKIFHRAWYVFATIIILAAVLVSAARLLTPILNQHRADFEKLASNTLGMPVILGQVELTWHRYSPEISLRKVTVLDADTQKPKIAIEQLRVDISLWRSVLYRQWYLRDITVSGVGLKISQNQTGEIRIGELASLNIRDAFTNASVQAESILKWIFTQPKLSLENILIDYMYADLPQQSLIIKSFRLQNADKHHVVKGVMKLVQEVPTNVDVRFTWEGDIREFIATEAHVYLNVAGFSIPQWFGDLSWQGLTLQHGVIGGQIWVDWSNKELAKVQTKFAARNIQLFSQEANKTEVIPFIDADLSWKHTKDAEEFVSKKTLIRFAKKEWEPLDFVIRLKQDELDNYSLDNLTISYVNLGDIKRLLLYSKLLPENYRQQLLAADPNGIVKDAYAKTLGSSSSFLENHSFGLKLKELSFKAFDQYPGVDNLTGVMHWDGKQGNVTMDASNISFVLATVFANDLRFSTASGNINFSKDQNANWQIYAKSLHVENSDVAGDGQVALTLFANGDSPYMDIQANFKVNNALRIANYLPLNVFNPNLKEWLRRAFLAGTATNGKATVQGNWENFPYDKDYTPGKFLISADLQNVELNYADEWPHLKNINGTVVFAGSKMTAIASSAEVMGAPLKDVQAEIPYIGAEAPQVVNASGYVQSDLQKAFAFIQQSPLRTTVGAKLANIQMSGPMDLKLTLSIPLSNAENTVVVGDVKTTDALFNMSSLKLALEHLTGNFQFTQNGVSSDKLTGTFFNEPAILKLQTVTDTKNNSEIRGQLVSQISAITLEKWLAIPLQQYVKGKTPFAANVFLSNRNDQAHHVVISSNLVGMDVVAPKPLDKTINGRAPTTVDVYFGQGSSYKILMDYKNVLSAAVNLEKTAAGFALQNGEIRIGSGKATYTTEPGVMVSVRLPVLDVKTWQDYFNKQEKSGNAPKYAGKFRGFDVATDKLVLPTLSLTKVKLFANNKEGVWTAKVSSNEIIGEGNLIVSGDSQSVEGKISRLNLNSFAKTSDKALEAKSFGNINLDITNISYKDFNFAHATLKATRGAAGLTITEFNIDGENYRMVSSGFWQGNTTTLRGVLETQQLTATLKEWGVNLKNFVGTTGKADFNLNWVGSPFSLALNTLQGHVAIKLGEGSIINLSKESENKIGTARLLNIFSLSSLPRSFGNSVGGTFNQGFMFDSVTADFDLKNGQAVTNNLEFDGPIARVNAKGRIGLASQDLNLNINVTPYVTGSLPVVAGIAGGPIGIMAGLLVDRMVSVSQIITYRYQVRGSWQNPSWEALGNAPDKNVKPRPIPGARTIGQPRRQNGYRPSSREMP